MNKHTKWTEGWFHAYALIYQHTVKIYAGKYCCLSLKHFNAWKRANANVYLQSKQGQFWFHVDLKCTKTSRGPRRLLLSNVWMFIINEIHAGMFRLKMRCIIYHTGALKTQNTRNRPVTHTHTRTQVHVKASSHQER